MSDERPSTGRVNLRKQMDEIIRFARVVEADAARVYGEGIYRSAE